MLREIMASVAESKECLAADSLESVVEPGCAEDGAAAEGGVPHPQKNIPFD
jgi:hypothetical protein